jgi:AI-2 transport protein TqsA
MLLSVPLTMIVKIALESSPDTRWVALLLASDNDEHAIQNVEDLTEDKE